MGKDRGSVQGARLPGDLEEDVVLEGRRRADLTEEGLLQLAEVAHLYYIKNLTQGHIAERIGMSRSNVSRMLKEARDRGLVEIRIHAPLTAAGALQEELGGRLGLRECLVLANPRLGTAAAATASDRMERLSALGARYLQENIADGSVVGVSWSSTVYHVVSSRSSSPSERLGPEALILVSTPPTSAMATFIRTAPATGTQTRSIPNPSSSERNCSPLGPPTGATAREAAPLATRFRETLMPLPPASTVIDAARCTPPRASPSSP